MKFQSPISGVNDWNDSLVAGIEAFETRFSLLSAELMIGTTPKNKQTLI